MSERVLVKTPDMERGGAHHSNADPHAPLLFADEQVEIARGRMRLLKRDLGNNLGELGLHVRVVDIACRVHLCEHREGFGLAVLLDQPPRGLGHEPHGDVQRDGSLGVCEDACSREARKTTQK